MQSFPASISSYPLRSPRCLDPFFGAARSFSNSIGLPTVSIWRLFPTYISSTQLAPLSKRKTKGVCQLQGNVDKLFHWPVNAKKEDCSNVTIPNSLPLSTQPGYLSNQKAGNLYRLTLEQFHQSELLPHANKLRDDSRCPFTRLRLNCNIWFWFTHKVRKIVARRVSGVTNLIDNKLNQSFTKQWKSYLQGGPILDARDNHRRKYSMERGPMKTRKADRQHHRWNIFVHGVGDNFGLQRAL